MVKVKVFANLREDLGWKEKDIKLKGNKVKDLLLEIGREEILKNKSFKILVNGRDIDFLKGLETELKETDVVSIFPPVAGGNLASKK